MKGFDKVSLKIFKEVMPSGASAMRSLIWHPVGKGTAGYAYAKQRPSRR
ncbi:hypothetical protein KBT16_16240 [Nostoc sp. CCCryo 231-06]|nr:hypothetical protein [Nostoc sp. CCCryo 231-06]